MPSPRRSLRTLLCLVTVRFVSAPAVAAESTEHVDNFGLFGAAPMIAASLLTFAFGLFWVNVLVHVAVPWRRVERFDAREAAIVGGATTIAALGVVHVGTLTMAVGWSPLPVVLAITAVGYASVAGARRTTLAAVTATLALFLVTAAGSGWPLPVGGMVRKELSWYVDLVILALAAGCFTHVAGAIGATYRTRTG